MMSDPLVDFARWVTDIVYSSGYVGIFVLIALSNLHLPIPSQLVLPFAGFLVSQGRLSFILTLAASTGGAVAASLVLYLPGLWLGEERLRQFIGRSERFKLVSRSDLDRASEAFERHGWKAILVGHLVPGIGGLISIPAGLKRMPILGRFMVCTILGSTLWNVTFIGLGWALGTQWAIVERYVSIIEYVVLAAIIGAVFWFLRRRWATRRTSAQTTYTPPRRRPGEGGQKTTLRTCAQIVGVVTLLISVVGLVLDDRVLLGVFSFDILDDVLHLLTGGVLLYVGFGRTG